MTESDDLKFKRIKTIRETMDSIKQKRSKLSGELEGNKKRLEELKKECLAKYQVDIVNLPEIIKKLDADAEKALQQAEAILKIV